MRQSSPLATASVREPCAAGLCRLRSAPAAMRTFPTLAPDSVWRRLDPYPAVVLRCLYPFLPGGQRPCHRDKQLGPPNGPCLATSTGGDLSGLQSFTQVQAPPLAWPPGCTHRQTSACLGRPGRIHQAELRVVTNPEHWHRYVPEAGNGHGGTCTRWTPSLSAAPVPESSDDPV